MKTIFFLIISTGLISCRDEPQPVDCGCSSIARTTIPESANLIGQISYKYQSDPNDNFYNDTFWISYTEPNCSNCVHTMIVCNESFLPEELTMLSTTLEMKQVIFAGELKETCEKIFSPADYTYERIILTKIELQ